MKRSGPLRRKTPLSRGEKPLERRTPLRTSTRPMTRSASRARAPEVEAARAFRDAVWELCGGVCVMTEVRVPRSGSSWVWNAHHVLPKQALPLELRWEPLLGVVLTRRAHERHTSRTEVVPYERLPNYAILAVSVLGDAYADRLLREHPPLARLDQPNRRRIR